MLRHHPIFDLIIFQLGLLLVALSNAWILRRARRHAPPARWPRVSVLIPARNEERNIERCVTSLLAQDYPDFEVLVLDDESTDRTAELLRCLAAGDGRLGVLAGEPPAAGWLGKNWACAQLAERATGELLYFTDADTWHHPRTLRAFVSAMEGDAADLMGGFPRQEVQTPGERLIVPFFSWVIYCFTPLWLAYRLRLPALVTAVGQALLFRRAAYEAIGGHGAVRAAITEDLELARRVKAGGYRWRMLHIADRVSCRMYRSGREAGAALSRNLFAAFGFRLIPFLFAWGWLLVLFWRPYVELGLHAFGQSGAPLAAVLTCIGLALVLWLFVYHQLGLPLTPVLVYPVTVLAMAGIALRSLWLALSGRLVWKDRALIRPRLKWF